MGCAEKSTVFAQGSELGAVRTLAERVYRKVQAMGTRQVRMWHGMALTYPYPCRRGYGTRGELVGIYTITTRLEWIEADLFHVLGDSLPSCRAR
ncbi:MAG: hypothetical protein M0Z99_01930 [Betaproteobacteria bacterium]|nr:hypothetical protein [Betaproteobacteria bacterium]